MTDPVYVLKPVSFAVFLEGRDFQDESSIVVSVDDEGAGTFLTLRSNATSEIHNGQLSLDYAALEAVMTAAKALKEYHG